MTGTSTITLPGTAHGKIEGDFVFLTKRVRIPRGDILAVKPSMDGAGDRAGARPPPRCVRRDPSGRRAIPRPLKCAAIPGPRRLVRRSDDVL